MSNSKILDVNDFLKLPLPNSSKCRHSFLIENGKAILETCNFSLEELKESETTKRLTIKLLGSLEGYTEEPDIDTSVFHNSFRNLCVFGFKEKISIEIKSYNLHYGFNFPDNPHLYFKLNNATIKDVDLGELSHEASDSEPIKITVEFESITIC